MADDDSTVTVTFRADVGELDAGIGLVKAQLASLNAEVSNFSRQMAASAKVANDALKGAFESVAAEAKGLKTAIADADVGLSAVEKSAVKAATAFGSAGLSATYLTRETRALLDEAAAGRWRQFDGTIVNLATHMAQMAANFAATNPVVAAAGVAIAAVGGYLAYLTVETLRAAQVFTQFKESLNLTGAVQLTDAEISELSEKIRNLAGVSRDQAKEIVASFGAMQNQSKAVFETIAADLGELATARDIKPEQMAKELEDLFSKPYDAASRLIKIVGDLTDAEREMLRTADQSGDPAKAQAAVAQVLEDHLGKLRGLRERDLELSLAGARAARDQMETMGGEEAQATLTMLNSQIAAWEKELAAIKAANDEARKQAGILEGTQSSAEVLRQRFDDVLKSISPWTSELQKAQDAIAALRAGLQASTGDAAALIKQFEGFKDKAYLDSDGKYRVGFGSDTTTSASGASSPVTAETTTTREDAERDLAKRIVEFQAEAAREIGGAWARLTDEAKASITSVAYNYGHVPSSVVSAAQTGGNAEIAGAIGALPSNPGRRAQEAANITGGGAAVTDPEKVRQGTEAIAEQKDKILQVTQAKAGGSEIEKAQLANLEAELAGRKDEVAAAERTLAAAERQLALTSSAAERAKLTRDIDADRVSLQEKQNAAKEAELRLSVGRAQGTGDAAGQRDAAVALAEFKMSLYGQDTAEYKAALGEKEAADRAYEETVKQTAMRSAEDQLKSVQSATQAKIREYDTDAKAHLISERQKIADTEAALSDEIAKERDILNQELALDNLRPPERKKILDELAQLEQQYAQQVKQVQTQAAADAAKSWESLGSTIDGAINSQLKSVLSHAESFRTAMAKIAEDLALKFVEKGEQIATNWIADQAAMKTATDLGNLGSSVTSFIAEALRAIAAGAGQTAAAVSGFLAPVLGPAAVPAGLAAGAAIEAGAKGIGMMDIGAWDIPQNQLAMVHKNELVMPAPEAGAFRSLLSGAAQGSSGGGGDVHHHWNVSAIDSQSFVSALRNHASPLSKIVAQTFNRDGSTRPRY